MKNRIMSIVLAVLFSVLITAPSIIYYCVGENTDHLLEEKRDLAEWPDSISNDYFPRLEKWYNDHMPFRLSIITFYKKQSQKLAVDYRTRIHPVLSSIFTPSWYTDGNQRELNHDSAYFAPISDNNVIYGKDGWLFYSGENSVKYYTGSNLLSEEEMRYRRSVLEKLNDICNAKGIQLAVMVAPNKEQVYPDYVPSYYIENSTRRESAFLEYMKDSDVRFLYPLDVLSNEKQSFCTYFKQDTHWNSIGAFLGVMEIYKALSLPYTDLSHVEIAETSTSGGDLSSMCGYASAYTGHTVNYKPQVCVTSAAYQDGYIEVFSSNADTTRKLVMAGDSFRIASKEFLVKDFAKSTVFHANFLDDSLVIDSIKELSEGDVLLLLRVERYDDEMLANAETIIRLLES